MMPTLPEALANFLQAVGAFTLIVLAIGVFIGGLAFAFYPAQKDR